MIPVSQRGTALAEFAIASVAALTLIFGIVDVGRALYSFHLITSVAREASRYAIVNGAAACPGGSPSPDPLQAVVSAEGPLVGPGALAVSTSCASGSGCMASAAPYNARGCSVSVQVAYTFRFLVPIVSGLVIPMSSTSTMVISQ